MVKIGFGIKKTLQNTIIFATILMKYSQQYDYSSLFFCFHSKRQKNLYSFVSKDGRKFGILIIYMKSFPVCQLNFKIPKKTTNSVCLQISIIVYAIIRFEYLIFVCLFCLSKHTIFNYIIYNC